jgi:hypothetical protein
VEVTLVTVTGFATVMFWRILTTGFRNVMTTLANTGTLCIPVLTLAAGIAEVNLARHAALSHIAANKIDVSAFCISRIISIIFNVGTMTVITLNILILGIVVLLVGVTVTTKVELILLTG